MKGVNLIFFSVLAGVYFFGLPVYAFSQDYCFEEAGKLYHISPSLLWAISQEESRFNPYAVSINSNGTYDYGHMQINSWWADKIGAAAWDSLGDPCQCTKVGAWILSKCIRAHGYTWKAIGCYHANNKDKQIRYAWKIYSTIEKLK